MHEPRDPGFDDPLAEAVRHESVEQLVADDPQRDLDPQETPEVEPPPDIEW